LNGAVQRAVAIGDPARYPELVGAVEALAACRAVSDEVARDARHRLDDTFAGQATPSPPDAHRPAEPHGARSIASRPEPRRQRVG